MSNFKDATHLYGYEPSYGEPQVRGDDRDIVHATAIDTDAGIFKFIEDPSDGYRSYMEEERIANHGELPVMGISGAPNGLPIAVVERVRTFSVGDRVVCVSPVDPILSRGAIYTVGDISIGLYEMMEAPGFLFGDWRFKPTPSPEAA